MNEAPEKTRSERLREARILRRMELQEADRERTRIMVLRAVRREAKSLPEHTRERYVAVQTVIRNPRPDPMVGLFFGVRA